MFLPNKKTDQALNQEFTLKNSIDKPTLLLIRIACILNILFFTGILVGIPFLLFFLKSQYINFSLGLKDLLKYSLENYLY